MILLRLLLAMVCLALVMFARTSSRAPSPVPASPEGAALLARAWDRVHTLPSR